MKELEAEAPQKGEYACSFIPEYVLEAIAQSSSSKIDAACRSCAGTTIAAGRGYHEHRGSERKIVSLVYSSSTYVVQISKKRR